MIIKDRLWALRLYNNLSPQTNAPCHDLYTMMCFTVWIQHNISQMESMGNVLLHLSELDIKGSNVLVAVERRRAGGRTQRGLALGTAPSSADMQYHLSKYLDNWIWEGSQARHYNQRHCQQCHLEAASSWTRQTDIEQETEADKQMHFQPNDRTERKQTANQPYIQIFFFISPEGEEWSLLIGGVM